jgi:ADP-ribose pyrophosphatase
MEAVSGKAHVHHVEELHRGRVFRLSRERVTLPNGHTTDLEVVRHPGAAAVVPMLDEKRVVLIRQYRHAVGGVIWEIPAGTLSPGETPLACAGREIQEETGFVAGVFDALGVLVPVPGYSDERIHLFLATDLRQASRHLDQDEVLDVAVLPMTQALEMIRTGEIVDAKSIVGLLKAEARIRKGDPDAPGRLVKGEGAGRGGT